MHYKATMSICHWVEKKDKHRSTEVNLRQITCKDAAERGDDPEDGKLEIKLQPSVAKHGGRRFHSLTTPSQNKVVTNQAAEGKVVQIRSTLPQTLHLLNQLPAGRWYSSGQRKKKDLKEPLAVSFWTQIILMMFFFFLSSIVISFSSLVFCFFFLTYESGTLKEIFLQDQWPFTPETNLKWSTAADYDKSREMIQSRLQVQMSNMRLVFRGLCTETNNWLIKVLYMISCTQRLTLKINPRTLCPLHPLGPFYDSPLAGLQCFKALLLVCCFRCSAEINAQHIKWKDI